jgi:hypothetical protein
MLRPYDFVILTDRTRLKLLIKRSRIHLILILKPFQ